MPNFVSLAHVSLGFSIFVSPVLFCSKNEVRYNKLLVENAELKKTSTEAEAKVKALTEENSVVIKELDAIKRTRGVIVKEVPVPGNNPCRPLILITENLML